MDEVATEYSASDIAVVNEIVKSPTALRRTELTFPLERMSRLVFAVLVAPVVSLVASKFTQARQA